MLGTPPYLSPSKSGRKSRTPSRGACRMSTKSGRNERATLVPPRYTAIVTTGPVSPLAVIEISCNRNQCKFITQPVLGSRSYPEFSLFHAYVVITMQSLATEIFRPIGVLIVQHQQCEATILIERWSCSTLHGCTQNRCALITCCTS